MRVMLIQKLEYFLQIIKDYLYPETIIPSLSYTCLAYM